MRGAAWRGQRMSRMTATTGQLGRRLGELYRDKGGRGRRDPTARRVTHDEAASGDMFPVPKVVDGLGMMELQCRVHYSVLQSADIACHGMQMASYAWPSLSTSFWEFLRCSMKINS